MLRDRLITRRHSWNVAAEPVDVSLVLAADCSGSVGIEDLVLQFRGYAHAITNDAFIGAVQSGRHGRIALTFVGWSDARRQDQLVPWTLIDGIQAARRFAATLFDAPAPIPGFTSISGAIDFSRRLLSACSHPSDRQVIDVSGDGTNNDGRNVMEARDEAVSAGIRINGLPIVREEPNIAAYYTRNVIGGPAAFVTVATDIGSFHSAVLEKFVTEIAAAPGEAGNSA